MKRKIPPISALILAESAARLGSFKEAAQEQLVTASAASHQIRSLEEWLGIPLFIRGVRNVELTEAGRSYLGEIGRLLNELEYVTFTETNNGANIFSVRLQTTDSFANRWLVARLPRFLERYPNISVSVETTEFSDDFKYGRFDVGILFEERTGTNLISKPLLSEEIYPVCHPKFISKNVSGHQLLENLPLIEDKNLGVNWEEWIQHASSELMDLDICLLREGSTYSHSHLAIRAAELGNGLVLASETLVADALRANTLVAPFKTRIKTGCGYYLITPRNTPPAEQIQVFLAWLERQALLTQFNPPRPVSAMISA